MNEKEMGEGGREISGKGISGDTFPLDEQAFNGGLRQG
jgi:hypothetical protein